MPPGYCSAGERLLWEQAEALVVETIVPAASKPRRLTGDARRYARLWPIAEALAAHDFHFGV
ncbi:MAG: hypothetical protein NZ585_10945 [Chloracidobacterium sp.]|nr:hypothetical protein [Chloracidobacterium sp.]MDW8217730.1 hypothetical protein [Acidobacteriota bacterium]